MQACELRADKKPVLLFSCGIPRPWVLTGKSSFDSSGHRTDFHWAILNELPLREDGSVFWLCLCTQSVSALVGSTADTQTEISGCVPEPIR